MKEMEKKREECQRAVLEEGRTRLDESGNAEIDDRKKHTATANKQRRKTWRTRKTGEGSGGLIRRRQSCDGRSGSRSKVIGYA
jgi:hypothetical protein